MALSSRSITERNDSKDITFQVNRFYRHQRLLRHLLQMMMMSRYHYQCYHLDFPCYFEELAPDAAPDALLPEEDEKAAAARQK
jgi:hypothetical protein